MPSAAVLAPLLFPLAAAGVTGIFGLAGANVGRLVPGAGAWGCVAALLAVWVAVRASVELVLGQLGYGSAFAMRIVAASLAFGLMVAARTAVTPSVLPRQWQVATLFRLAFESTSASVVVRGRAVD